MRRSGLAHFTPSMDDPALLEAVFTAREDLIGRLMDRIRDSATTDTRHYSLLTGPRGIGKTHIVSLLYYRVRADAMLADRLRIAWLLEDPWGINSYPRLLREILDQLDKEYGVPQWTARLEHIVNLSPTERDAALEGILVDFLGDRVLLLLVENLDLIFSALKDEGQKKLRAFLQNEASTTIVATSTSLLALIGDRAHPFFGFFKKYPLQPFRFEDCVQVLLRISHYMDNQSLIDALESPSGRSRIRAIHHLAGGNPRIYLIFQQFLTRESLDNLLEPFRNLVQELTPYYQGRMQTLSPLQRSIVDIIRRHEAPIPVKSIAEAVFSTSPIVSSELKRLKELGYVEATEHGRQSLYELREPLMRICLAAKEMRGGMVPLFVEFLRIWFTESELEHQLDDDEFRTAINRQYLEEALKVSRAKEDPVVPFIRQEIEASIREGNWEVAVPRLYEVIDRAPSNLGNWYRLDNVLEHLERPHEVISLWRRRTLEFLEDAQSWNRLGLLYWQQGDIHAALEASTRAVALAPETPLFLFNHAQSLRALHRLSEAMSVAEQGLALLEEAATPSDWSLRAGFLIMLQRYQGAVVACKNALVKQAHDFYLWRRLCIALDKLAYRHLALRVSENVCTAFPNRAEAWHDHGLYMFRIDAFEKSLASYERARELDPTSKDYEREMAYILVAKGEAERGLSILNGIEALDNPAKQIRKLRCQTIAALQLGDHDLARASLSEAIEIAAKSHLGMDDWPGPSYIVHQTQNPAAWQPTINLFLHVFRDHDAVEMLGSVLLNGLPRFGVDWLPSDVARRWLQAWVDAAGDLPAMHIPLKLFDVAVSIMETADRRILLSLPIEQRSLLEPLIDKYIHATGDHPDEVDRLVDDLLTTVERTRAQRQKDRDAIVKRSAASIIDDDLLDQLFDSYDARRRPPTPLRPLLFGGWSAVPKGKARRLLKMVARTDPALARLLAQPALHIRRMDWRTVSFSDWMIYQVHVRVGDRVGAFDLLAGDHGGSLLDGASRVIYHLIQEEVIVIRDQNEADYLHFFCNTIRGEKGRFEMVDPKNAKLVKTIAKQTPSAEITAITRSGRDEDGKSMYKGCYIYTDGAYQAVLTVDRREDGKVRMLEDTSLANDLNIDMETYDGPLRFWDESGD